MRPDANWLFGPLLASLPINIHIQCQAHHIFCRRPYKMKHNEKCLAFLVLAHQQNIINII